MTKNKTIKKEIKRARKQMLKGKGIEPITLYIKSKNPDRPSVAFQSGWHDDASRVIRIAEIREICRQVEAGEVMMVMDTYMHSLDPQTPSLEAITVSIEDADGFQCASLPYEKSADGKIKFKKMQWQENREIDPEARLEGLVQ